MLFNFRYFTNTIRSGFDLPRCDPHWRLIVVACTCSLILGKCYWVFNGPLWSLDCSYVRIAFSFMYDVSIFTTLDQKVYLKQIVTLVWILDFSEVIVDSAFGLINYHDIEIVKRRYFLRDAKFTKNYSPKRKDYVRERITRIASTTIIYIQFVLV